MIQSRLESIKAISKIKKMMPLMSVSSTLTGIKRGTEYALAISNVGAVLLKQ